MTDPEPAPKPRRQRAKGAEPVKRAPRRRAPKAAEPEPQPIPEPEPVPEPRQVPALREKASGGLYDRLWNAGVLNVLTIARRELGAFFVSPIGYVVTAVLIVPVSVFGYMGPIAFNSPVSMDGIFSLVSLLMVFITPLYTMRLLAEERRSGTLELLLTSPVRDWELVVGKWLGGFVFYISTIAFTLVYAVLISVFQPLHTTAHVLGRELTVPNLDYGPIVTGYLGVILVGAAWVSLGLLASSLTSNQIIAAVVGVGLLLTFQYLLGQLSHVLLAPYSGFFDYMDATGHARSFSQGRLLLKDAVYFLTLAAAAMFITTRVLESRKWR